MMSRTLAKFALVVLIFTLMCVAAYASPVPGEPDSKPVAGSLPSFPYSQGWLGADDAYSVPLTATRSLWLFGDTFVADPETTERTKAKSMARNSVGITTCEPGNACTIEYFWKNPKDPKPRSFFDTGTDETWYWPMDAYRDGDTLYLSQMIVKNKKGAGPEDPFGFEIAGTQWMVVHNVLSSPEKWKVDSRQITDGKLWVGNSVVADGKYVLFYSQVSEGEGKGYMIVLRVPKNKLAEPEKNWEYLGTDKAWHTGTPHGDAMHVIEQGISEMSVRYHPSIKKWVAISGGPEFPTNYIAVRTADHATGPWSAPQKLFEFPEMKQSSPGYDRDTFCYATKEHVEFGDVKLVLTYACNSFKLQKVIDNMQLYRPQLVVVDLPK